MAEVTLRTDGPQNTPPRPPMATATGPTDHTGPALHGDPALAAAKQMATPPSPDWHIMTLPDGRSLKFSDVVVGTGDPVKVGDQLSVKYMGWHTNGSSFDHNDQFPFTVGDPHIIAGWSAGVMGMQPGGVRRLIIPPDLAYGPPGRPPVIAPNETLLFEIQVNGVAPPPAS